MGKLLFPLLLSAVAQASSIGITQYCTVDSVLAGLDGTEADHFSTEGQSGSCAGPRGSFLASVNGETLDFGGSWAGMPHLKDGSDATDDMRFWSNVTFAQDEPQPLMLDLAFTVTPAGAWPEVSIVGPELVLISKDEVMNEGSYQVHEVWSADPTAYWQVGLTVYGGMLFEDSGPDAGDFSVNGSLRILPAVQAAAVRTAAVFDAPAETPEPSSLLLMAGGILAFGIRRCHYQSWIVDHFFKR